MGMEFVNSEVGESPLFCSLKDVLITETDGFGEGE
jgi:hypothetical protein